MTRATWTVNDARRLRQHDTARRSRFHHWFGRHVQGLVQAGYSSASHLFGPSVYSGALQGASKRMNANRYSAFAGYEARASDIICAAYFKAGTNWLMHVCYQIANLGEGDFDHIQDEIAWPDAAQPRYWRALNDDNSNQSKTGFRVIKSHLSADLVPLQSPAKIVAMTRDPLDCAASGYHFFANLYFGPKTPPPDVWLDFFASDDAFWGPWYRFTASWWQARSQDNVLFMRFEDLKADPNQAIENIAAFLGVSLTSAQVQRVADQTSFATMKKMNDKFYPVRQTIWSTPGGRIIRKGEVGDGSALFGHAAVAQFNARMANGLSQVNCDLPFYPLADKGADARASTVQDATV